MHFLYGVFKLFINILFYLKDMFVWGTKGSFELTWVFFVAWENVCMLYKLHIFKIFFFPLL